MEKSEIKKALYREKPTAHVIGKGQNDGLLYSAMLSTPLLGSVTFDIPKDEVNESFTPEMPAQLLIRWMQ